MCDSMWAGKEETVTYEKTSNLHTYVYIGMWICICVHMYIYIRMIGNDIAGNNAEEVRMG